jgi:hypothetical protein
MEFRAKGVGVKIFEKFASGSERDHEIDSIVEDLRTAHSDEPAERVWLEKFLAITAR